MITMSETAAKKVSELRLEEGKPEWGLRIRVVGGGCSGMSYELGWEDQQQVDDKCFARFDDVPEMAITLTIPRLLRARRLFCVVPGLAKRQAVRDALYGPVTTACPASILRQADCTLYLDPESDPDVREP